jgi:hypothetical protein
MMAKPLAPKGAVGGNNRDDEGWIGDQGKSLQVQKFEAGTDFLFFQGPAPTTAVQEDLPDFLSAGNLEEIKEGLTPRALIPRAIVTATGVGAFAVVAYILITQGSYPFKL